MDDKGVTDYHERLTLLWYVKSPCVLVDGCSFTRASMSSSNAVVQICYGWPTVYDVLQAKNLFFQDTGELLGTSNVLGGAYMDIVLGIDVQHHVHFSGYTIDEVHILEFLIPYCTQYTSVQKHQQKKLVIFNLIIETNHEPLCWW